MNLNGKYTPKGDDSKQNTAAAGCPEQENPALLYDVSFGTDGVI
jgi:hypothetical protein